ncbi:MAG: glycosyltransferase [Proteobacteria bacterium]|nr:glycosyltransferase [Pseudomonadota bacterium]
MQERGREAAVQGLRILVLTDTPILGAGGSERFLRYLLSRLPQECEVDVLQFCAKPDSANIVGNLDEQHVRLAYRPIGAIYGIAGIAATMHVRGMIRRGNYDIVQSHHEKSDLITALLPRRSARPKLLSNRRDMGFQKSGRMRWLMRRLNHRYDRIVAPSAAILDSLVATENVAKGKVSCIPNGVDTTRFRPADVSGTAMLRKALGFSPDELLIGCVATLFPVKRHEDLLDAFARVHASLPEARLLLIGDGPLRERIEGRIRALRLDDVVQLMGDREDVAQLMPLLDVFVLASDSEGLSNAILEAQACGLPVVATRVGGNPDLVREDCGKLVEAGNPSMLAEAMLELLRDPAARSGLGTAARARVEAGHSLQIMVDSYLRLYRDLISEP